MLHQYKYYKYSTYVLHITTLLYLVFIVYFPEQYISIAFSILYTIELILKIVFEGKVYLSQYYSIGFVAIDLLAGPIALLITVYVLDYDDNK